MIDLRKYSGCSPDELRRFVVQVRDFREQLLAGAWIVDKLRYTGVAIEWNDEENDFEFGITVPLSTITDDEEAGNTLPFDEPIGNVVPFRGRA